MGCGVDFNTDSGSGYVNVFFTKNGKQVRRERDEGGGRGEGKEKKELARRIRQKGDGKEERGKKGQRG